MTTDTPRIDGFLAMDLDHVQSDAGERKTSGHVNKLLFARQILDAMEHDDDESTHVALAAQAKLERAIVELHNAHLLLDEIGLGDVLRTPQHLIVQGNRLDSNQITIDVEHVDVEQVEQAARACADVADGKHGPDGLVVFPEPISEKTAESIAGRVNELRKGRPLSPDGNAPPVAAPPVAAKIKLHQTMEGINECIWCGKAQPWGDMEKCPAHDESTRNPVNPASSLSVDEIAAAAEAIEAAILGEMGEAVRVLVTGRMLRPDQARWLIAEHRAAKLEASMRHGTGGANYVIWSGVHNAWWGVGGFGYSTELIGAGLYERDDAIRRMAYASPEKQIHIMRYEDAWSSWIGSGPDQGTVGHAIGLGPEPPPLDRLDTEMHLRKKLMVASIDRDHALSATDDTIEAKVDEHAHAEADGIVECRNPECAAPLGPSDITIDAEGIRDACRYCGEKQ